MTTRRVAKEYRCPKCDRSYASFMQLQHHKAAEHALKTQRDIRTTRGVPHGAGTAR